MAKGVASRPDAARTHLFPLHLNFFFCFCLLLPLRAAHEPLLYVGYLNTASAVAAGRLGGGGTFARPMPWHVAAS
jgi:hypothetical protein